MKEALWMNLTHIYTAPFHMNENLEDNCCHQEQLPYKASALQGYSSAK
jgi:hypothetical protein